MTGFDLVFRARRVVTAAGEVARCIAVRDGRVAAIEPLAADLAGAEAVTLADDEVLLPGLVDTHVHVNEPGRTEWEGFATRDQGGRRRRGHHHRRHAAQLDPAHRRRGRPGDQAQGRRRASATSTSASGAGRSPATSATCAALHDAGVFGFKCFLLALRRGRVPAAERRRAATQYLEVLAGFDGAADGARRGLRRRSARAPAPHGERYADFLRLAARAGSENVAVAQVIEAARWTGGRVHILHLSVRGRPARCWPAPAARGCAVTRRDLPALPDASTPRRSPTAPPSSSAARRSARPTNRERLWQGLGDGVIDWSCPTTRRARPS